MVSTKILSSIINVFKHQISHSEGSCDTEDWSNSFRKFNFAITITYNLKYIEIELNSYLKCKTIL